MFGDETQKHFQNCTIVAHCLPHFLRVVGTLEGVRDAHDLADP